MSEISNTISLTGFEGPEKLLEIWFSTTSTAGLRSIHPLIWHDMLKIVQCQVLSTIHNDSADAYLLSESSMFVYSNRLILKTCGTTTLLNAVPCILKVVEKHCNISQIDAIFYSRKSFLFPERQKYPHGSWNDEVISFILYRLNSWIKLFLSLRLIPQDTSLEKQTEIIGACTLPPH